MDQKELSLLKKLEKPKGKIDVVLDTDAYNEIDDQFALAYLLRSKEKLNTKAIYAALFIMKSLIVRQMAWRRAIRKFYICLG